MAKLYLPPSRRPIALIDERWRELPIRDNTPQTAYIAPGVGDIVPIPASEIRRMRRKGPPRGSPFYVGLANPTASSPRGLGQRVYSLKIPGGVGDVPVPDLGDIPAGAAAAAKRAQGLVNQLLSGRYDPSMANKLLSEGKRILDSYRERAARLFDAANALAKQGKRLDADKLRKQARSILAEKGGALWTNLQRMAYVYMAGKSKMLDDLIRKYPWIGQLRSGVKGSLEAYGSARRLVDKLSTTTEIDAGGIVDGATLAFNAVRAIVGIASALDLFPEGTAADVVGWTGVVTGCVSGILAGASAGAALGPAGSFVGGVLGTVGCGVAAVTQFFSSAPKSPPVPKDSIPRAVYSPNVEQKPYVAADAARMAAIMRYWYGVRSLKDMFLRAGWHSRLAYLQYGARPARRPGDLRHAGSFPPKPPFDQSSKKFGSLEEPVPAPTLVDLLVLLDAVDAPPFRYRAGAGPNDPIHLWPHSYWYDLGSAWPSTVAWVMKAQGYGPKAMRETEFTRDLSVSSLFSEVWHWRQRLINKKDTYQFQRERDRLKKPWHPSFNYGYVTTGYTWDFLDGRPFLRLSEIIDYFAAVTVEETRLGLNPVDAFLNTYGLPVRQMINEGTRDNPKWQYARRRWSGFKETELWLSYRLDAPEGHNFPTTQQGLLSAIKRDGKWNWPALRVLGAIRARAAMAYMISALHWYVWGKPRLDMIGDLPSLDAGGATMAKFTRLFLRGPDLRQYVGGAGASLSKHVDPLTHRYKRVYTLKARPLARLTDGDPAAAMAAVLAGHNEKLRPAVTRALTDVALNKQYSGFVTGKLQLLPAAFPESDTTTSEPPGIGP